MSRLVVPMVCGVALLLVCIGATPGVCGGQGTSKVSVGRIAPYADYVRVYPNRQPLNPPYVPWPVVYPSTPDPTPDDPVCTCNPVSYCHACWVDERNGETNPDYLKTNHNSTPSVRREYFTSAYYDNPDNQYNADGVNLVVWAKTTGNYGGAHLTAEFGHLVWNGSQWVWDPYDAPGCYPFVDTNLSTGFDWVQILGETIPWDPALVGTEFLLAGEAWAAPGKAASLQVDECHLWAWAIIVSP